MLLTGLAASASNELLMPTPPASLSPSTAAFAEYGTASVNPYSGTPSIELPLVSVNAGGGHSWPISIAYNCSGIKAYQPAGIVGAGWTLKSAGVITASRNDLPDETNIMNTVSLYTDYGDYGWYIDINMQMLHMMILDQ